MPASSLSHKGIIHMPGGEEEMERETQVIKFLALFMAGLWAEREPRDGDRQQAGRARQGGTVLDLS